MIGFKPPENWPMYMAEAFLVAIGIRLVLCFLRWTARPSDAKRQVSYWRILIGYGAGREPDKNADENADDYLHPAILGYLELLVYPILLAAGKPEYIGAWLGLKVVPKFGMWSSHRETYQRFLIGNALAIISSYFLQEYFY